MSNHSSILLRKLREIFIKIFNAVTNPPFYLRLL